MKKRVLVLNYHRISTDPERNENTIERVFSVTKPNFKAQVETLARLGIPVISLDDFGNDKIDHQFSVAITIDDGNHSDYEIVYPVLKAHGMTATFFFLADRLDFISREQVNEMIADGFSIGSHGISHIDLTKLNNAELKHELEQSKKVISEKTGQEVKYFSFPFGIYNNRTIEQSIKAGYRAVLSTNAMLNQPAKKIRIIHRWSVKRSLSARKFERILRSKFAMKQMITGARFRKFFFRIIGRSIADRINGFIHS